MVMELADARGTWSKSSEEVRRSLDVLDKVLSEFDDIGASNENVNEVEYGSNENEAEVTEKQSSPPRIDRTLKPQDSAPALPKKERKSVSPRKDRIDLEQYESYPAESLERSATEASSHEYQEISSDLVNSSRRSKSAAPNTNNESLFRPVKAVEQLPNQYKIPNDIIRGRQKIKEIGIRKCRSRDNIPSDSKLFKEKIQKRKIPQRRSKSSERIPSQRQSFSRRVANNNTGEFYHPNQFDHIPVDPHLLDPRFLNTVPLDPRLRYKMDNMLLRDQIPYVHPFNTMDNGAYFPDDQIPFPHLLHNPNVPLGMHPPIPIPYYPEDISCDMLDPNFQPHILPNGYIPVDPMNYNYPYPLHLENLDAEFAARNGFCPPEYAFDVPLDYYGVDPANYPVVNEKYGYPIPPYIDKTLPLHDMERIWMASQQEQMALQNLRNLQQMEAAHLRNGHRERMDINEIDKLNRRLYHRSNSVIDRTEARKSMQRNKVKKSASHSYPVTESLSSETSFRVGEVVNCLRDDGGEIMSPTNFSSGGKDSGFDETPPMEALTNRESKSPHPVAGGGFIVSGVFNDSSKMYIPVPPSPTPDYDGNCPNSDGEESDILQSSLYQVKPKSCQKKLKTKENDMGNLSDDSLQDTNDCSIPKSNTKSLQTMIKEFHNGLPTPGPEPYSDDSLDESSAYPSRPSSIGIKSRRIMSMESLTSIDGSTTSFDYIKGGSGKSVSKNKKNMKRHSSYVNSNLPKSIHLDSAGKVKKVKDDPKKGSSKKQEKFDTIRNLIKDGLLEGLDEQPPNFKPPPANKGSLEKSDSGVSSRASTAKSNESGESPSKSRNSSFSEKCVTNPVSVKKLKNKDPAPKPPTGNSPPSGQNQRSPTNHSWLHKQKRQAPIPKEMTSKCGQENKREKVTHIDELLPLSSQAEESDKYCGDGRQRPLSAKYSSNIVEETYKASTNHEGIDFRINYPVFTGPLVSSEMAERNQQQKQNGGTNRPQSGKTEERPNLKKVGEQYGNNKHRKTSIELNSSPLNYAINKNSQKDSRSYNGAYTGSKKIHDVKQSNNWSSKFRDDCSKSRFNIFKGFWRRNKYSFDKF